MGTTGQKVKAMPKQDLITAAGSGDRLTTLIALRDLLADRLQNSKSDRDIAAISRRLMQCVAEIEDLEKQRGEKSNNQLDFLRAQFAGRSGRKTGSE